VTDASVLAEIAAETGVDAERFTAAFVSADARNETSRDFLRAQELGIRGFPTVLAGSAADGYALLTNGYRPLDGMIEALETWLGAPQVSTETPVKK
jgi:putative protein-disulfide isomerase